MAPTGEEEGVAIEVREPGVAELRVRFGRALPGVGTERARARALVEELDVDHPARVRRAGQRDVPQALEAEPEVVVGAPVDLDVEVLAIEIGDRPLAPSRRREVGGERAARRRSCRPPEAKPAEAANRLGSGLPPFQATHTAIAARSTNTAAPARTSAVE